MDGNAPAAAESHAPVIIKARLSIASIRFCQIRRELASRHRHASRGAAPHHV
jgi:hypothetical protein